MTRGAAGAVVLLAVMSFVTMARAHGGNNYRVGSTMDGGGALAAVRTTEELIPVSFSATLAGFGILQIQAPRADERCSRSSADRS